MKRIFKIIAIILVVLVTLILFCSKTNKISLIENIRPKISQVEENIKSENEVTTIDITYLEDNGNMEHEHIIKTMYNENEHWEECTICGQKQSILKHNFTTVWDLNSESCQYYNFATNSCSCGYSYVWHKPCVWDGSSYNIYSDFTHAKKCKVCGERIMYDYYKNGILYSTVNSSTNCATSNGTRITCSNGGYCSTCKNNRESGVHFVSSYDGMLKCRICNTQFGTYSLLQETKDTSTIPVTYTTVYKVNLINATYTGTIGEINSKAYQINTQSISNINSEKTEFIVTSKSQLISDYKQKNSSSPRIYITSNRKKFQMSFPLRTSNPDVIEPTISSVTSYDNTELIEWSKNKPLIITGTENYCNKVKVKIVEIENEENIVFETETNVSSNNYSVSCIPELEVNTYVI